MSSNIYSKDHRREPSDLSSKSKLSSLPHISPNPYSSKGAWLSLDKNIRGIELPTLTGSNKNTYSNPPLSWRYNNLKSWLNQKEDS